MKLSDIDDAQVLATKQDLELLRHQLIAEFRKELIGVIIWIGGLLMGLATIILGGMYFLLTHMKTP
jgi:hypothetical protein